MKLFLDSAIVGEIHEGYAIGIIDGVTTNPSLIKEALAGAKKKSKKIDLRSYLSDILLTARGTPVSIEVTQTTHEGMVKEGLALYNQLNPIANNVYIKIPINPSMKQGRSFEGIRAIRELSQRNIPVNCTLVFTPEQALLAARAGARIVSLFVGRMDDYIRTEHGIGFEKEDYFPVHGVMKNTAQVQDNGILSGVDLVQKTVDVFKLHTLRAQVLAASIRNTRQLRDVALAGAHIATVPFSVLKEATYHAKTLDGMKRFNEDVTKEYEKLGKP